MPSCVVCSGSRRKERERRKDVTLFRFPKDANRLHQWLDAVRPHLKPPWTVEKIRESRESGENARLASICSDHFSPTCCRENLKTRFQPYTNTRGAKFVLTEDAIPSVFREETSRKVSETQREKRIRKRREKTIRKQLLESLNQQKATTSNTGGPQSIVSAAAQGTSQLVTAVQRTSHLGAAARLVSEFITAAQGTSQLDTAASNLDTTHEMSHMDTTHERRNMDTTHEMSNIQGREKIEDESTTFEQGRASTRVHSGGVVYQAGDSEEDGNPPVTGVLGFSMETTLALLPRMYMEELLAELDRRNIVVQLSTNSPRGRDDLEHVLKEVMMREYEEWEGVSDADEDMSDNRSSFDQDPSLVNDGNRETSNQSRESMASAELAPELSQTTLEVEKGCSQPEGYHVHEMPSTQTCIFPAEVQVKKEPVEKNNELCVTTSSTTFNNVTFKTEPSTSDSEHPGIGHGSHPSMVSAPNFVVKVKTEPGVEEYLPDNVNISSESCVSLPGQRFQELKMVKVTNTGNKSSSSTPSKKLPGFVPSCTSGPSRTAARHPAPVYNSDLNPTSVSRVVLTQADPDPD